MAQPAVLFFGSFQNYSVEVAAGLLASDQLQVVGVVTTPPQPAGRQQVLTPTPVQVWAEEHHLPVFAPTVLDETTRQQIEAELGGPPDLIVTAGYGKLLPPTWLTWPHQKALNLHFSLLPKFRGANPAEWALLLHEHQTGITLIEMSPTFDTGKMVAQAQIPITDRDTRETIYEQLYQLGGKVLAGWIHDYLAGHLQVEIQPPSPTPYAKRLQRDDGFVAWSALQKVQAGQTADQSDFSATLRLILSLTQEAASAHFVERAVRALVGYPGVWTLVPTAKGQKRMKILTATVIANGLKLESVQLEGQAPASWNQVKNAITS